MNDFLQYIESEQTQDGSLTLYRKDIDEHYHSVKGALTESLHIFVNMGLKASSCCSIHLLEVGFGTGLNAFLTLLATEEIEKRVDYIGLELYPLSAEIVGSLSYPDTISPDKKDYFYKIHSEEWGKVNQLTPLFSLCKLQQDFLSYDFPADSFDVVYFDAFAPEKQSEMWSERLFTSIYKSMRSGGILTTYCAKGEIRRRLQSVGFKVERLPGPPGGKREILRAVKE